MRVDRLIGVLVIATAAVVSWPRTATAPDPTAADAAFDAGDTAAALAAYEPAA